MSFRDGVNGVITKTFVLAMGLCLLAEDIHAEPQRRALLVGINDYQAQRQAAKGEPVSGRTFPNLRGAVNDVELMRGLLVSVYGFGDGEIVSLTDGKATREGILKAIDQHLVAGTQRGDVVFFYFSGHGSQVRNSLSEELDGMDESIVPADVSGGARDIRDKELLRRFTPLIERGVRLTILLDSCHSGSGVRGLPGGGRTRVAPPDLRDARDGYRGPSLEDGGALVLSAALDHDTASEIRTDGEKVQGLFSWAWAHAVRDAARDEPAIETFHRAAARMSLERPEQVPALAGNAEARFAPFLGTRRDRQSDRVVVGVRSVQSNGVVQIRGGWANGLTVGSVLRPATSFPSKTRLEVIELNGMASSTARIRSGEEQSLHSGALLELVSWAPPRDRPLRVWMPQGGARVMTFARTVAAEAKRAGIEWLHDPLDEPTADRQQKRILRWNGAAWELFNGNRERTILGNKHDARDALSISSDLPLFIQLPASPEIVRSIGAQPSVEPVDDPQDADYILTGRLREGQHVQYAWVRPSADDRDRNQSRLPLRTDWHDGRNAAQVAATLKEDLRRLQRIHLWQTIPSPPEGQYRYRLAIRQARDNALVTNGTLSAEERYGFVLRTAPDRHELPGQRFVYVFMVDSYGKSVLFYPRSPAGTVENRFPYPDTAPDEIRLGSRTSLIPEAPLGTDTYFLLSTEEPLTDPWILEWAGVRTPGDERGWTSLERLLVRMLSGDRGVVLEPTPSRWSIERLAMTSIANPSHERLEGAR